jgi:hypothetical protein
MVDAIPLHTRRQKHIESEMARLYGEIRRIELSRFCNVIGAVDADIAIVAVERKLVALQCELEGLPGGSQ